jgi:hypothetical protein
MIEYAKTPIMKSGMLILTISCLAFSCHTKTSALDTNEKNLVTDGIRRWTSSLISDLSIHGPVAWLNYFEESPDFFMVANGQLAFKDYQSGKVFVEDTLIKYFVKINLQLNQLRIDPLTSNLASIGAGFHEELIDSAGKMTLADGYLTGLVKQTNNGWKFRNLQWSMSNFKKN